MIKILSETIYKDQLKNDQGRNANTIISDTVTHYLLGVGSLPLVGDLQVILDARFNELWPVAVAKKNKFTTDEARLACYNSPLAGGWTNNEFQEAVREDWEGKPEKRNRIMARGAAIRAEWPI